MGYDTSSILLKERGEQTWLISPLDECKVQVSVNEVCQASGIQTLSGRSSTIDALLPMLEPASACEWRCPATQLRVNLSGVTWTLTANTLETIPKALLSRCRVFETRMPTSKELAEVAKRRLYRTSDIETAELAYETIAEKLPAGSTLRHVDRLCESLEDQFANQHPQVLFH